MKYKLLGQNELSLYTILQNRHIEDPRAYLNLTEDVINDYKLFGLDNLKNAATMILRTIRANENAVILVDCDCDGFSAASLLANYLYKYFPTWVEDKLDFYLHGTKTHGLTDCYEYFIEKKYKLVIAPDSSSNDYEQCLMLNKNGAKVVILDHHAVDDLKVAPLTIIINNQLCDYPNKAFCGAGVVWQFCRFLNDTLFHDDYYKKFIDLAALGLVGDMMSMVSDETALLIREGIKDDNLHNPFITYMREKNAFSIGPTPTPMGWAFYIVPFVNAMVRSGTLDEQELLFNSFLEYRAFKEIPSTKRGCKGEFEKLVEQAVRTATNVKARQTKAQDAAMEILEKRIDQEDMLSHKVLLFLLDKEQIAPSLAGLVANKIMAKYQRPVCVLTRHEEKTLPWESAQEIEVTYAGSARGCALVGATEFRSVNERFDGTVYAQGHSQAHGLCLKGDRIQDYLDYTDDVYKDIADEAVYYADYITDYNTFLCKEDEMIKNILEIGSSSELWGQDVTEPYIVIENISVTLSMVSIYEKRDDTLKLQLSNNISAMKFKISKEEKDLFKTIPASGSITITIVGQCRINVYNGTTSAQIEIKDFELLTTKKFDF